MQLLRRVKSLTPPQWTLVCVFLKIAVFGAAYFWVSQQGRVPQVCSWDCGYYHSIAQEGYAQTLGSEHSNLAFFPAFPLLVKILMSTGLSFVWAALLLNLALFAASIRLLLTWSQHLGLGEFYFLPALLLTLDRFSLWTHVPYTETLFLFFLLSSFVVLRTPSFGKWQLPIAALMGGLASGVRLVGVALIAGLGLARLPLYLRKPHLGVWHLFLGLSGLLTFFAYLEWSRGAWNLNILAAANWNREFNLWGVFNSALFLVKALYFPTILIFVAALWAIFGKFKSLQFTTEEKITGFLLLLIPLATNIQTSMTRYLTLVILAYPVWALWIQHYKKLWWKLLWAGVLIAEFYWQIVLTAKFFRSEVFLWAA